MAKKIAELWKKFKYLRTKAGGLLTQRPRNLTPSPAQVLCIKCLLSRKVHILSDRGIGFHKHTRSRSLIFSLRILRRAILSDTLWALPVTLALEEQWLDTHAFPWKRSASVGLVNDLAFKAYFIFPINDSNS